MELRAADALAGPLAASAGVASADAFLGPPNASDLRVRDGAISGERWHWRGGGWAPAATTVVSRRMAAEASRPALWLDAWAAYERTLADNVEGAVSSK